MKNLAFKNHLLFVFIFNLLVVGFVLTMQSFLPPVVPLLYGLPKGEDQLVPKLFLVLPALSATAVLGINTLGIKFIKDDFLQKSLFYVIVVTSVLATVTTIKIVFLVGSI